VSIKIEDPDSKYFPKILRERLYIFHWGRWITKQVKHKESLKLNILQI